MPCIGCEKECKCTTSKCAEDCKCSETGKCGCRTDAATSPPNIPPTAASGCCKAAGGKDSQAGGDKK